MAWCPALVSAAVDPMSSPGSDDCVLRPGSTAVSYRSFQAGVAITLDITVVASSALLRPIWPSSASSVISLSLRRRKDEDEDVKDPARVPHIQADDSADSVSSDGEVNEKTVSCWTSVSRTD
jgi:hypothetical protein